MATSKTLEKKLEDLRADSVRTGAEFKQLDEQIDKAKLELGMQVLEGKKPDKSKLNELAEKRDELGLRLNALAKKMRDTQAELEAAKAAERTAKIEAYKAESEKQLEQMVKVIYELNTLAGKWLGLAREADHLKQSPFDNIGLDTENLPIKEIIDTTNKWMEGRKWYLKQTKANESF